MNRRSILGFVDLIEGDPYTIELETEPPNSPKAFNKVILTIKGKSNEITLSEIRENNVRFITCNKYNGLTKILYNFDERLSRLLSNYRELIQNAPQFKSNPLKEMKEDIQREIVPKSVKVYNDFIKDFYIGHAFHEVKLGQLQEIFEDIIKQDSLKINVTINGKNFEEIKEEDIKNESKIVIKVTPTIEEEEKYKLKSLFEIASGGNMHANSITIELQFKKKPLSSEYEPYASREDESKSTITFTIMYDEEEEKITWYPSEKTYTFIRKKSSDSRKKILKKKLLVYITGFLDFSSKDLDEKIVAKIPPFHLGTLKKVIQRMDTSKESYKGRKKYKNIKQTSVLKENT